MHGITEEHTGSMGVFFSGIYPSEIDKGEFDRLELFFTKGDMTDMVSKYGYEDLSDGWYAYTYILPGSTNEPQHWAYGRDFSGMLNSISCGITAYYSTYDE